jgi:RHS repeat-associated protein
MQKQTNIVEEYRFGFQGQLKDNEWTGTEGSHLAFKYRVHDARIGRFLSVDPLTAKYPHNSPYAFSENRVIDKVEFEGLEQANPPVGWSVKREKQQAETYRDIQEAYDELTPRQKNAIEGPLEVVAGVAGVAGSIAYMAGTGGVGTFVGGFLAFNVSIVGFKNGLAKTFAAIEGEEQEYASNQLGLGGEIAEACGASEELVERVDFGVDLIAIPFSGGPDVSSTINTTNNVNSGVKVINGVKEIGDEFKGDKTKEVKDEIRTRKQARRYLIIEAKKNK